MYGLTPTAPEPRKLSASPEGRRSSAPSANAMCSPYQAVPLAARRTSPKPLAEPDVNCRKDACALVAVLYSVPAELTPSETLSMGTAIETSTRLVRPKVA